MVEWGRRKRKIKWICGDNVGGEGMDARIWENRIVVGVLRFLSKQFWHKDNLAV